MDFKQLKYFACIAERGNMTRAAEELHVAQPALTKHMANLEAELGVRVFDRGRSGVSLTAVGEVLYVQAKSLLRHLDDAHAAVRDEVGSPSGRVVVGMSGSTAKLVVAPLLHRLAHLHRISLEIVERPSYELQTLVSIGTVDIAIVVDAQPSRGTTITPLLVEDLYVILAHGAAGARTSLRLHDIVAQPLVLPTAPNTIRLQIDAAFREARLEYRLVAETSASDILVRMATAELGWTILPWAAVGDEVRRGLLDALPIRGHRLQRELGLCVSDAIPPSRATEIVRENLLKVVDDLVTGDNWPGVEALGARAGDN